MHLKLLYSSLNAQDELERLQLSVFHYVYFVVDFLCFYPCYLYFSLYFVFIPLQLSNQSLLILLRLLIEVPFNVDFGLLDALTLKNNHTSCYSDKWRSLRWISSRLTPNASIRAGNVYFWIFRDELFRTDWLSDEKVVVILCYKGVIFESFIKKMELKMI